MKNEEKNEEETNKFKSAPGWRQIVRQSNPHVISGEFDSKRFKQMLTDIFHGAQKRRDEQRKRAKDFKPHLKQYDTTIINQHTGLVYWMLHDLRCSMGYEPSPVSSFQYNLMIEAVKKFPQYFYPEVLEQFKKEGKSEIGKE